MWSTAERREKNFKNVMQMLGLNGAMDQLATANSVHWRGHV